MNDFKCDHCTKVFNEEWKLSSHNNKHEKYQCDQCEKSFDYLDIKRKCILISHENMMTDAYFCMKMHHFANTMQSVNVSFVYLNTKRRSNS
jgi:hypothetical protein